MPISIRAASRDDVVDLNALIERSARQLSAGYYTPPQIEAAIRCVFGVDTRLVDDQPYYAVSEGEVLVAVNGCPRKPTRPRFVHSSSRRSTRGAALGDYFWRPAWTPLAILINLTPGQDTFYILGRSIAQDRRAGFLSVFGITSGCAVHTLAAAFGLSAIYRAGFLTNVLNPKVALFFVASRSLMLRYCTTAGALGAGWFVVLLAPTITRQWLLADVGKNLGGGLANPRDTLSPYVMGLTATAISFYVVVPCGLVCQHVMESALDAGES